MITTTIDISGTINGYPIVGSGTSKTNLDTGVSQTTIVFTKIGIDVDPVKYGKSWHTKHHPRIARRIADTPNLLTLSPEGYDFETNMTYGSGHTIISTGQVRRVDQDTHSYKLVLKGTLPKLPKLIDGDVARILPATAVLNSKKSGLVSMEDAETIVLSDRGTIELKEVGTFTLLNSKAILPFDEQLLVSTEGISFNRNTLTLQLNTTATISPVSKP